MAVVVAGAGQRSPIINDDLTAESNPVASLEENVSSRAGAADLTRRTAVDTLGTSRTAEREIASAAISMPALPAEPGRA